MITKYGLTYMGSKASICDELVRVFPKAKHFYDVFGGGFSVTHAMLLRRPNDYDVFHFNEIREGICDLIKDAISGNYSYDVFKPKFISKEEFHEKKESDAYIKIVWSFGSSGIDYLFSKENEIMKKSIHNAIIFNEFDEFAKKKLGLEKFDDGISIKKRRFFANNRFRFKKFNKLLRLQHLERLEKLQRLEKLKKVSHKIEFTSLSYEKIKIEKDSVVYCDPPYKGTAKYDDEFDHEKFLDWADQLEVPCFISEYNIEDKRFKLVKQKNKRSFMSSNSRKMKKERLYLNRFGYEKLLKK